MANYVGKGKKRNGKFGEFITFYIDLNKAKEFANEKGFINLQISEMKNQDQYGNSHTISVNEYKKETKIETEEIDLSDIHI